MLASWYYLRVIIILVAAQSGVFLSSVAVQWNKLSDEENSCFHTASTETVSGAFLVLLKNWIPEKRRKNHQAVLDTRVISRSWWCGALRYVACPQSWHTNVGGLISDLAVLLPVWLPANMPRKAAVEGPSACVPHTGVGDSDGVLGY